MDNPVPFAVYHLSTSPGAEVDRGVRDALHALHGRARSPLQHPLLYRGPLPPRAAIPLVGTGLHMQQSGPQVW